MGLGSHDSGITLYSYLEKTLSLVSSVYSAPQRGRSRSQVRLKQGLQQPHPSLPPTLPPTHPRRREAVGDRAEAEEAAPFSWQEVGAPDGGAEGERSQCPPVQRPGQTPERGDKKVGSRVCECVCACVCMHVCVFVCVHTVCMCV